MNGQRDTSGTRIIQFGDFSEGYRSQRDNKLLFSPRALAGGKNVDTSHKLLETRPGYSIASTVTTHGLPAGSVKFLSQIWFPSHQQTYLIAQVDTGSANKLYISTTSLPSTAVTFTELYDLGTSVGTVELATLNDRAIFVATGMVPLVFSGAQDTSTYTDWPSPATVLLTLDGTHFHDITQDVCDYNSSTTADIGSMTSSSYIYVRTDVPKIEQFYVDIGTASTTDTESAQDFDMDISAITDVSTRELKSTITSWVQDSDKSGHFEDSGSSSVTHGAGNTASLVEVGCVVYFDDDEHIWIDDITDDGEGTGEVTLRTAHASGIVDHIYRVEISGDNITVGGFASASEAQNAYTLTLDSDAGGYANYSIRQRIQGTYIDAGGLRVRVTLEAKSDENLALDNVSIGVASGNYTTADTPVELLFSGGSGVDIAAGTTETSDWADFEFESTDSLIVIMDVSSNGSKDGLRYKNPSPLQGVFNRKSSTNSYNIAEPSGVWTWSYSIVGVTKIEVPDDEALDTPAVIYSNSILQKDATAWSGLNTVTITETLSGSAALYHSMCLNKGDDDETWKVYLGAAWRDIARLNGGTWQYNDASPDNWVSASTNDRDTALEEAFADADNQMTDDNWEALTVTEFAESGGFVSNEGTIDFAACLIGDSTDFPLLDKWSVNATTTAILVTQGYNGSWTQGYGWTDGTKSGSVPFAQDGAVDYDGSSPFTATYTSVQNIPGYWYRFYLPSGTSSGTTLAGITFKAPTQALARIAPSGFPETMLTILYEDAGLSQAKDMTVKLSDDDLTSIEYLDDEAGTPNPMNTDDSVYAGSLYGFFSLDITVDPTNANTNSVTMTVKYWDGDSFTAVSNLSDGTAVSGKSLARTGRVTWTMPTDWKQTAPASGAYPLGYYVQIQFDAQLSSRTALAEMKCLNQLDALVEYHHVTRKLDRLCLGARTDAGSQIDISRALEEYGIQSGDDSYTYTGGASDAIITMDEFGNEMLAFRQDDALLVTGTSPSDFSAERLDVGKQVPLSQHCTVFAPTPGEQTQLRTGAYYLNHADIHMLSGIETRAFLGLQRARITDPIDVWDQTDRPRVDPDYLHLARGAYWPEQNWLVWAVPLIVEKDLDASAVTDEGGGEVGLAATGHGMSTGDVIGVVGTTNYDGSHTLSANTTANKFVFTDTYAAETITATGKWYKGNQTANSHLLIFDLKTGAWMIPWNLAVDSLCTAYEYNANAPGKLGQRILLAGDSGGNVYQLFDSSATDDAGTDIDCIAELGWLTFGKPDIEKTIRWIRVWANTQDTEITLKLYKDGSNTLNTGYTKTWDGVAGLSSWVEFTFDHTQDLSLRGRAFKPVFSWSKPTSIYLVEMNVYADRWEEMET